MLVECKRSILRIIAKGKLIKNGMGKFQTQACLLNRFIPGTGRAACGPSTSFPALTEKQELQILWKALQWEQGSCWSEECLELRDSIYTQLCKGKTLSWVAMQDATSSLYSVTSCHLPTGLLWGVTQSSASSWRLLAAPRQWQRGILVLFVHSFSPQKRGVF